MLSFFSNLDTDLLNSRYEVCGKFYLIVPNMITSILDGTWGVMGTKGHGSLASQNQ